jgi:hypothetical protein
VAKHEFVIPEGAKTDDLTPLTICAHVRVAVWSQIEGGDLGTFEAGFEELVVEVRDRIIDWYGSLPEDLSARIQVSLTTQ